MSGKNTRTGHEMDKYFLRLCCIPVNWRLIGFKDAGNDMNTCALCTAILSTLFTDN